MKKLAWMLVLLNAIIIQPSYAKDKAPAAPATDTKVAEMKKKVEAKKAELNGSQWEVLVTSSDGKNKDAKDTLVFQNGQVTLKGFAEQGFNTTNYTITVPEGDGMTVWETMQTSPKEGVVFIRGEWKGDEMRGIISQQLEGGKTNKDYTFKTASKVAIDPMSEDKKKAEAKAKEAATPPPAKVEEKAADTVEQAPAAKTEAVTAEDTAADDTAVGTPEDQEMPSEKAEKKAK